MSDPQASARLAAKARGGDRGAFVGLVEPHLGALVAYAQSLCSDRALAEDAVQESVLIAFTNIERLFPEADFRTWLKAIVRRQALSAGRRKQRFGPLLAERLEAAFEVEAEELQDERQALRICLDDLPERMSAVVQGFYADGGSISTISDRLVIKPATVKTLLHRARALLRDCVERRLRSLGRA